MRDPNAGHMRGRRFVLVVLAPALLAAAPEPGLDAIRYHALAGLWACQGRAEGEPLAASLRWELDAGGEISFSLLSHPPTPARPRIGEGWVRERATHSWHAEPDPNSADPATWTSPGWRGATLRWTRLAAETHGSRTFTLSRPGKLTLETREGSRTVLTLACTRTHPD